MITGLCDYHLSFRQIAFVDAESRELRMNSQTKFLKQTGVIITKSHLQNFLIGPPVYFPGGFKRQKEKYVARLLPSEKHSSACPI